MGTTDSDPDLVAAVYLLDDGPGGSTCWDATYESAAGYSHEIIASIEVGNAELEADYPACPGVTAPRQPAATPAQLAETFWDTLRLPVPAPTSPPGQALTGQPAYLLTGVTTTPPAWTRPTPFGLLRVTAAATFRVDWGDGTPTSGPYTTSGGPYPTGTITHVYENVGAPTITVTATWTATWRIGAAGGTLHQLQTTGTIRGFRVGQLQPVITQS